MNKITNGPKTTRYLRVVEREIGFNEAHFYRLYIDGEAKVFEEETPQPTGIAAVNQMPSITGADISLLEDAIIRGQGNE